MHIAEKNIEGRRYYYLQHSQRIKDKKNGKSSRIKTSSVYLGTAEKLLERLQQNKKKPLEVELKEFGLLAALIQVSTDLGLLEILQERFSGSRFGVPRWLFFFLTIINRIQDATSKEQMAAWTKKTVLPELLQFDANDLNSKAFWYATNDVISEADLKFAREAKEYLTEEKLAPLKEDNPALFNDLFAGVDDAVFHEIVDEFFSNIKARFHIPEPAIVYDTTNFFTYISNPAYSELAKVGHNKDYRHHLRQVGMALAVDKTYGVPFYYRVYRGNSHDSKTFAGIIDELLEKIKTHFPDIGDLVLILDKGNNSQKNFQQLTGKINWVGSLDQSKYPEYWKLDPSTNYEGQYQEVLYHAVRKKILGTECLLVNTYRPSLARKHEFTMQAGLVKLTNEIQHKWDAYKERPTDIPTGIKSMLTASRYGKFLKLQVREGRLIYAMLEDERANARERFGKNLLFTDNLKADATWVIENYDSKYKIEESFKLIKNPNLVCFRPIRHFTDTKIAAFSFCCVIALMLIRVLELLFSESGMKMSPELIKEELNDIKAVTLVYGTKDVEMEITRRSSVQQKLWDLLRLQEVVEQLPYKA